MWRGDLCETAITHAKCIAIVSRLHLLNDHTSRPHLFGLHEDRFAGIVAAFLGLFQITCARALGRGIDSIVSYIYNLELLLHAYLY